MTLAQQMAFSVYRAMVLLFKGISVISISKVSRLKMLVSTLSSPVSWTRHTLVRLSALLPSSFRYGGIELDVGLTFEVGKKGEFLWTVYGEVRGSMTTSNLVEKLKGTFLDIALDRPAPIATNRDSPNDSHSGHPISKGLQFCATIERTP